MPEGTGRQINASSRAWDGNTCSIVLTKASQAPSRTHDHGSRRNSIEEGYESLLSLSIESLNVNGRRDSPLPLFFYYKVTLAAQGAPMSDKSDTPLHLLPLPPRSCNFLLETVPCGSFVSQNSASSCQTSFNQCWCDTG